MSSFTSSGQTTFKRTLNSSLVAITAFTLLNIAPAAQAELLPLQNALTLDRSNSSNFQDDKTGLLDRLNNVASDTVKKFSQSGMASWYGRQFHGRKSANGERFDMNAMTAAHRSLPLNCFIRVTNKSNGKSVVVKVTDRGPFHGNRVLDLSYGAAQRIGIANSGVGNVMIERIDGPQS